MGLLCHSPYYSCDTLQLFVCLAGYGKGEGRKS